MKVREYPLVFWDKLQQGHMDSGKNRDSLLREKNTSKNGSEPELEKC